jgi:integrase/recombinase XerD
MERREIKFFNDRQIEALRKRLRTRAKTGKKGAVTEWAIIDTLVQSGIRVSECADLRCRSLKDGYGECALFIAHGKGNKDRYVQISENLKDHLRKFIAWKIDHDEAVGGNDYLFIGQRGAISAQGIQVIVKKHLKALGIYELKKSVHSLRHSYATRYYRESQHDIRGLQKQLGHSSVVTTQIYADTTPEEIQANVNKLWQ